MGVWSTNGVLWQSVDAYRRAASAALADLELIRDHGPLPKAAIPLVAVVKNEAPLIGSFLDHYRKLGVARFLIVDNGSTDGTFEMLAAAPDVDLWRTEASYEAANHGGFWMDGLLWARARDRWVLVVDADEFLVFSPTTRRPGAALADLIERLKWRGETRLFAPMLDVYADRPIGETIIDPDKDPLTQLRWFDGDAESYEDDERGVWVVGGARRRLFFAGEPDRRPGLSKYPLVYYDAASAFIGIHTPTPASRNYLRPLGRLIHIKLHAGLLGKAAVAVEEGEHWQDATEYRQYLATLSATRSLNAHTATSVEYKGPQTLIDCGFMFEPTVSINDVALRLWRWALGRQSAPSSRNSHNK